MESMGISTDINSSEYSSLMEIKSFLASIYQKLNDLKKENETLSVGFRNIKSNFDNFQNSTNDFKSDVSASIVQIREKLDSIESKNIMPDATLNLTIEEFRAFIGNKLEQIDVIDDIMTMNKLNESYKVR